jgi:porin
MSPAKSVLTLKNSWRIRVRSVLAIWICICSAQLTTADEPAQGDEKFSLIEKAPELYYTAKRYSRFYGDKNTVGGNVLDRSFLLGNLDGDRDFLTDHGVYFDVGLTQFLQGNTTGGADASSKPRYSGSLDLWLWLDSGKAGLWPGGAVFVHGEGRWNEGTNSDIGALLPANDDSVLPSAKGSSDPSWAVSEWHLLQALPGNLLVALGKIDMAAWADTNPFANRERSQFQYAGLVNNAVAGPFLPYTSQGAWLTWTPSKAHTLTAVYAATDDKATQVGFDDVFNGDDTFAVQYVFTTNIAGRPGSYKAIGLFSTKDLPSFAISNRHLIEEIVGAVPIDEESENYAVALNFSQYLWVKDDSMEAYNRRTKASPHPGLTRHSISPVGIGVFGRVGWAPKDRNSIDQFYSFGFGGFGMLIPGRDADQWGVGYAGSHISSDLQDLPTGLRSWEHALEVFYNFSLTPAVHLTLNTQIIRPAVSSLGTAFSLGGRLQLDF